jgi:hypothetical protein
VHRAGRSSTTRLRFVAAAFMVAAAGLAVWAPFPEYYAGGASLRESGSLSYNLPAIVAWALAGLLLLFRHTAVIGPAVAFGATGVWWATLISNVGTVTTGAENASTGFLI